MKKIFLIFYTLILVSCSATGDFKETKKIEYLCGTQKATLRLTHPEGGTLKVDGKKYAIKQTIAASGAKYVNEEEKVVFWGKGNEASLEIDNLI